MTTPSVTLLDGGMGTELRARGVEVPDHTTSIWSAKALLDAPDAVEAIHRDYIRAGADVITANNYMLTPTLLARAGLEPRLEELIDVALDLAHRARDTSGRDVRIAGSLPPLDTSYRADKVGRDAAIFADYQRIAARLAPRVDVLLCETLSSAREAAAAVRAATELDRDVWLSWTLQGGRPDHLPSGEHVQEAYAAVADTAVSAFLVNCCGANFVQSAVRILRDLTDRPIGGYANAADVLPGNEHDPAPPPEQVKRELLDVDGYADAVMTWIAAGATLVGGCCSTRPEHIARIRERLDNIS